MGGNDSDKELINSPIESKINYEREDRRNNNYFQDEIYSVRKRRNKKNELTLESDEKNLLFKRVNSINFIKNKYTKNSFNNYYRSSELNKKSLKLKKRKISAISMNNNYNIKLKLNQGRRKSSFNSFKISSNGFEKGKKLSNGNVSYKSNIDNKKSLSLKSIFDINKFKNYNDNSNTKLNSSDKSSSDESEINFRNIIKKKNKNNNNINTNNNNNTNDNTYTFSIKQPILKISNVQTDRVLIHII